MFPYWHNNTGIIELAFCHEFWAFVFSSVKPNLISDLITSFHFFLGLPFLCLLFSTDNLWSFCIHYFHCTSSKWTLYIYLTDYVHVVYLQPSQLFLIQYSCITILHLLSYIIASYCLSWEYIWLTWKIVPWTSTEY